MTLPALRFFDAFRCMHVEAAVGFFGCEWVVLIRIEAAADITTLPSLVP